MKGLKFTRAFVGMMALIAFSFSSCELFDGGVVCTEQFESIVVNVTGDLPDEVYTVQQNTRDTLTFPQDLSVGVYVVIDDSYAEELRNSQETFWFHAVRNGSVEIRQEFVVGADECHIFKVTGPDSI